MWQSAQSRPAAAAGEASHSLWVSCWSWQAAQARCVPSASARLGRQGPSRPARTAATPPPGSPWQARQSTPSARRSTRASTRAPGSMPCSNSGRGAWQGRHSVLRKSSAWSGARTWGSVKAAACMESRHSATTCSWQGRQVAGPPGTKAAVASTVPVTRGAGASSSGPITNSSVASTASNTTAATSRPITWRPRHPGRHPGRQPGRPGAR